MLTKSQRRFQNTLDALDRQSATTVSTEGLVSDLIEGFKGLFRYRPAKHGDLAKKALHSNDDKIKSVKKLKKLLQKCFLDDRWLDSHELVTGTVSATGIADRLCFGGRFNERTPFDQVVLDALLLSKEIKSLELAIKAHHDYVTAEHQRLLRLVWSALPDKDEIADEAENGEDYASLFGYHGYDTIVQFTNHFERSGQNAQLGGEHYYHSKTQPTPRFGGKLSKQGKLIDANPKLPNELPALTRQQIKTAAEIIVKWLESDQHVAAVTDWLVDRGVNADPDLYQADSTNEIFWQCVGDTSIGKRWASLVSTDALMKEWRPEDELDSNLQIAIVGLIEWMSRSIKGRLASIAH